MIDHDRYYCPICCAEVVEEQTIAVCPSCAVVLHVDCATYFDSKCPHCKTGLVVQPGTVRIAVSGAKAEEVESVASSLLRQIRRPGTMTIPEKIVVSGHGNVHVVGTPNPKDKLSLRKWWHDVLREHDRYPCYGIFLLLPSDTEAIRYLSEFGQELDLISAEYCAVIALSNSEIRRSGYDKDLWNAALEKHISEGHSLAVARLFKIEITTFPCLLLFRDIRSPEHVVVTLEGMNTKEICERMRLVFAVIQKAVSVSENPLTALDQHRNQENLRKMGRSIVSNTRAVAGKTFQTAMEAWIKAVVK